jgi:hypothetical protein
MARTPASSRRAAPTKVSKPFPWGVVLGSVVLAAALIGIIAYAALNQGSGVSDLVRNPDAAIEGVEVAEGELSRSHVNGPVSYEQTPPSAGDHNPVPQTCDVYTEPIAAEHALHSLEHGAVWITYSDELPEDQVEELADRVSGDPYVLLSPLPEQESPLVLSAWGRQLEVDSVGDERVEDFVTAYANGPQTPERGAACVGTSATGPLAGAPAAPVSPAPTGAATTAPTPGATTAPATAPTAGTTPAPTSSS